MVLFKKIITYITDGNYRFSVNSYLGLYNSIDDSQFLKKMYKVRTGKELDLDNPQTFNEKLQWLKLYDRNPLYTKMVDKYEVKEYVSEVIGAEYVIPTLGVWYTFDDVNFDELPDRFVLKCTHDSGGLVVCKDKCMLDKKAVKRKLNASLKRNYYLHGREWPYKNIKPRIIAEKYMEDSETAELRDYKFLCFNGEVKCSFVCSDRFSEKGLHVTFFDKEWNVMPFDRCYPRVKEGLPKPKNYEKMIELAEKLSTNIPFVRVDFYEVDGKIYFGELTFYPGDGMETFNPEEWDYKLGEWIKLPDKVAEDKSL